MFAAMYTAVSWTARPQSRLPVPGNMVSFVGTRGRRMLTLTGWRGGVELHGSLERVTWATSLAVILGKALKATLGCKRGKHYLESMTCTNTSALKFQVTIYFSELTPQQLHYYCDNPVTHWKNYFLARLHNYTTHSMKSKSGMQMVMAHLFRKQIHYFIKKPAGGHASSQQAGSWESILVISKLINTSSL